MRRPEPRNINPVSTFYEDKERLAKYGFSYYIPLFWMGSILFVVVTS